VEEILKGSRYSSWNHLSWHPWTEWWHWFQNWSIFDRVWTVIIDAGLPLFLWAEATNYIVYTKNRNSTHALTNTTPYEVQYKDKPEISWLHPFGCKAYIFIHPKNWKKLSPRASEDIFVGYADTQKAYQIYIPSKRKIICSVHIKFDVNTNIGASFKTQGEYQFQYNSLKSSCQEFKPDPSSSPEPVPSTTSSDDIISDPTPPTSNPVPVPNVPEQVPNAPPCAPSSCHIKPTDRGDSSRLQKVGQPNTASAKPDFLAIKFSVTIVGCRYHNGS
jgi:hypothetical protein